jgi:hypothetical protein
MSKHTPTPWVFEHRKGAEKGSKKRLINDSEWGRIGFWGSNHAFVLGSAESWDGDFDQPSDDDIDFILNAVNNHYELLGALKEIVELADFAMRYANRDGAEYDVENCLKEARRVIAKAEAL